MFEFMGFHAFRHFLRNAVILKVVFVFMGLVSLVIYSELLRNAVFMGFSASSYTPNYSKMLSFSLLRVCGYGV